MTPEEMLKILSTAAVLKTNTRHCFTEPGRKESIADHSWRTALMALLLTGEEEFRDVDMDRVIRMCLIHDLGEAFTGDIPAFEKSGGDEKKEARLFSRWVESFPSPQREQWLGLLEEMNALETREARTYKALDKLEAVISHNESDISTWLPLEYQMQLDYGREETAFSPFFRQLKEQIDAWTREKISQEGPQDGRNTESSPSPAAP
jgi:putative hydrolase of HD superfamily